MTTHEVSRITHQWAGLRTFVPDRRPVIGWDPRTPKFFWLAGQGGFGIQTSPGVGRLVNAVITNGAQVDPAVAAQRLF